MSRDESLTDKRKQKRFRKWTEEELEEQSKREKKKRERKEQKRFKSHLS